MGVVVALGGNALQKRGEAAVDFARTTGKDAVIGALNDLSHILQGTAGTRVSMTMTRIAYG